MAIAYTVIPPTSRLKL